MDWKLFAWLKRGARRRAVLLLLKDTSNPLTANDMKDKLNVALPQLSFTLKELRENHLVECLNPEDKIGKIYKITQKGKELLRGF